MSTQSLPAVSLRTGTRFPAARVLLRVVNHLICMALWRSGPAISGLASRFLPALREAGSQPALGAPGLRPRPPSAYRNLAHSHLVILTQPRSLLGNIHR
jgi:hypothetical protein